MNPYHIEFKQTLPTTNKLLGRVDELQLIREELLPSASPGHSRVILHGLGGIGKTRLASQFVIEHVSKLLSGVLDTIEYF